MESKMLTLYEGKVNSFNKLSKQQKKILQKLMFLIETVIKSPIYISTPLYHKISLVPKRTIQVPIFYISRMISGDILGAWVRVKQTSSFRASFSRSVRNLSERGLIKQYTNMNSNKTIMMSLTLLGLICCKKLDYLEKLGDKKNE